MAQYDIHRYLRPRGEARFVLDLQTDLLEALDTRVVAPIYERKSAAGPGIRGVNLELELKGRAYFVSMAELAAVHRRELGVRVGSLMDRRSNIVASIDLLFTGI